MERTAPRFGLMIAPVLLVRSPQFMIAAKASEVRMLHPIYSQWNFAGAVDSALPWRAGHIVGLARRNQRTELAQLTH
jgi:hypothetical protein